MCHFTWWPLFFTYSIDTSRTHFFFCTRHTGSFCLFICVLYTYNYEDSTCDKPECIKRACCAYGFSFFSLHSVKVGTLQSNVSLRYTHFWSCSDLERRWLRYYSNQSGEYLPNWKRYCRWGSAGKQYSEFFLILSCLFFLEILIKWYIIHFEGF